MCKLGAKPLSNPRPQASAFQGRQALQDCSGGSWLAEGRVLEQSTVPLLSSCVTMDTPVYFSDPQIERGPKGLRVDRMGAGQGFQAWLLLSYLPTACSRAPRKVAPTARVQLPSGGALRSPTAVA